VQARVQPLTLLRLLLVAGVVAVYLRHHLTTTLSIWLVATWAVAVATLLAMWACASSASLWDAAEGPSHQVDLQMAPLDCSQRSANVSPTTSPRLHAAGNSAPLHAHTAAQERVESPDIRAWGADAGVLATGNDSALTSSALHVSEVSHPSDDPSAPDGIMAAPSSGVRSLGAVQTSMKSVWSPSPHLLAPATPSALQLGVHNPCATWPPCAFTVSRWQERLAVAVAGVLSGLAFVAAVLWVQLVAEELVAALSFLGDLLKIEHALIGVTLLAWGAPSLCWRASSAAAATWPSST
jgi:hypothetical protein